MDHTASSGMGAPLTLKIEIELQFTLQIGSHVLSPVKYWILVIE